MAEAKRQRSYEELPDREEVIKAFETHADLLRLGEETIKKVNRDRLLFEKPSQEWKERLFRSVATLKDSLEAKAPTNVAATELFLTLSKPIYIYYVGDQYGDFTLKEEEDWTWGFDTAASLLFFAAAGVSAVLGLLTFSVLVYGFNNPEAQMTIVFSLLGAAGLSLSGSLLGYGLFRMYASLAIFESDRSGFGGEVRRRESTWRNISFYIYSLGSTCLAFSVSLAVIAARLSKTMTTEDFIGLRLAVLALAGIGLLALISGAWPVIRRIITLAEVSRRQGKSTAVVPFRALFTVLPILASLLLYLANWLFR